MKENFCILIQILLKLVPQGQINKTSPLVQGLSVEKVTSHYLKQR